jgi:L,D-peptidoglycan transpeptidase YkuD (ErfK/YbiS/YcfS/YnhG family)
MIIRLKNKDTLICDDFKLKCCIGLKGFKKKKIEGDKSTPKGLFSLGKIYYRPDRVQKPKTNLLIKKINKNMGWSDDSNSKNYNSEIIIKKEEKFEKLFRKDNNYDYFIVINYNTKQTKKLKGSAIFIHLTKNFYPTAGCIALKKKDFLILAKIINKKDKIKIG